tara:strand:+ start:229 stop:432 length:204 start_codon:yes stop_codon:yes gene_type:complete
MNVGYMTMNNLQLPKKQRTEDTSTQSKGLLSRGSRPQSQEKISNEPRDRIASYVNILRQARMELKNG